MKTANLLPALMIFVLVMVMALAGASSGIACNPPSGDNHYQGPAIRGYFVFEAYSETDNTLAWAFNGTCGAADIIVPQTTFPGLYFPVDITKQNLLENIIDYAFIGSCAYECEPYLKDQIPTGLQIIKVNSFDNTGDQIIVDVIMLWLVPN